MLESAQRRRLYDNMDEVRIIERLREFIECEMRSCSMDIGGITPDYVQRMWGGCVPLEDIKTAMEVLKSTSGCMILH